MRYVFAIVLILLTLVACYVQEIFLHFYPPQVGKTIYITLRAQTPFNYDQRKVYGSKKDHALLEYVPLYTYRSDDSEAAKKKIEDLISKIPEFRSQKNIGEATFWGYLKREFHTDFTRNEIQKLYGYKNLENLLQLVLTIAEPIMQGKIIDSPNPLRDKKTIDIYYPNPSRTESFQTYKLMTKEDACSQLREKVSRLLSHVDRYIRDDVLELIVPFISTNLTYDENENNRRIEDIIRQFPSRIIAYKAGDILVPFYTVMSDKDTSLINTYKTFKDNSHDSNVPWVVLIIILVVVFYSVILSKAFIPIRQKQDFHATHLTMLIITLVVMDLFILFTPLPVYALPFAFLPLALILLNQDSVSTIMSTLMGSVLVSLFAGQSLGLFTFLTLGGLCAILFSSNITKQIHILKPAVAVGLLSMTYVLFYLLDWANVASLFGNQGNQGISSLYSGFDFTFFSNVSWAFMGGPLAGILVLLFLPFLEMTFHNTSYFRLNKYGDPENPVLKDLLSKAPGTYQHTIAVASLVPAVGEAVGANTLLLRVGAYYHDIGKLKNPRMFAENQFQTKNGHENLEPLESARIIIDHVKNGKIIAEDIGLPGEVVDLILQHHGTQLVEYFYDKAMKINPELFPRKEHYQYRGPKPQCVEAAILMIVDAVEAALRSVSEPNRGEIEKVIRYVIEKRLAEGQFDDCNITTRDLAKIIQSLTNALEAQFHSRIMYPWQEKKIDFT
ncbi:MAG: HDIG domain-containing protein [Deltaproteobacteria bacterium]|nr:HDIG domain-containing protein [Deltaproteobacteria bacterium]